MDELKDFIIDPKSDEGRYRLGVWRLLESNPEKYPEHHSFMEMERKAGTIVLTMIHLGQLMHDAFRLNITISACADDIEKVTREGREEAQKLFAEFIAELSEGETRH